MIYFSDYSGRHKCRPLHSLLAGGVREPDKCIPDTFTFALQTYRSSKTNIAFVVQKYRACKRISRHQR